MRRKTIVVCDNKLFWKDAEKKLCKVLKSYGHIVTEVDTIAAVQETLHKSEKNMIVFCFCSTSEEKDRFTALSEKEAFPFIIITPYEHDPEYLFVKCFVSLYTTLPTLTMINEMVVP